MAASSRIDRRRLLGAVAATGLSALALSVPAAAQDGRVLVISRQRILRETIAGRALRENEVRLNTDFEARVDALKARFELEEQELARVRPELDRDEFDARASAFDLKVREARRETQRQAAAIQGSLRDARDTLVRELAPILVEVMREQGADVMLDEDQILIASPTIDMTERVIELFDRRVAPIPVDPGDLPPFLPDLPVDAAGKPEGGATD